MSAYFTIKFIDNEAFNYTNVIINFLYQLLVSDILYRMSQLTCPPDILKHEARDSTKINVFVVTYNLLTTNVSSKIIMHPMFKYNYFVKIGVF